MLRVLALLAAAPLAAADPAPPPRPLPDTAAFPAALTAALGEHFDYLGGKVGTTEASAGSRRAERFWYAKLRAKAPGWYVVRYTVQLDMPADPKAIRAAVRETNGYGFSIAVGPAGATRELAAGVTGGSAFPLANVGDTILLPVQIDPYRLGHRFDPVRKVATDPVLDIHARWADPERHRRKHTPGLVRNDGADRLDLLAGWCESGVNRSITGKSRHTLSAHVAFTRPGEISVAGRLADAAPKDGTPVRVVAKDRPVTAVADAYGFSWTDTPGNYNRFETVPHGTLEARVGDRILLPCGDYVTAARDGPDPDRTGVVEVRPFRDRRPYDPR